VDNLYTITETAYRDEPEFEYEIEEPRDKN
jgi:hypothetical protein